MASARCVVCKPIADSAGRSVRQRSSASGHRGYLTDGGPFPERLHLITLFGQFYLDLFALLISWADLAETEIAAWPHTTDLGMTDGTRALLEEQLARLEMFAERAAEDSAPGPPRDTIAIP